MASTLDELQIWYRGSMRKRADELRAMRPRLAAGNGRARDQARTVGMSLRGSGGTFGFPKISSMSALLETARDADVLRRVEGMISALSGFAAGSAPGEAASGVAPEWLIEAAALRPDAAEPLAEGDGDAWTRVGTAAGLTQSQLAARVGDYLGVDVADGVGEFRSARRLVPEGLARRERVVPIDESASTIVVAASDPTDLNVESELQRMTGRRVVYRVTPPETIDDLLAEVFPAAEAPSDGYVPPPVQDSDRTTAKAEPAVPRVEPAVAREEAPVQRVLVVDDEPDQRLLTRAILEKKGYEVLEAEDGVQALEVFRRSGPFGLVIADLNMPRMDGLELIWELRATEVGAALPIIVVTGEKDRVLESQLLEEGADDYIRKPIEPRLFLARVESTFRRLTNP